ncbi:MAG: hypothetical protein KDD64_13920 [Bdellovibrionales bacterium]|nr:hypothetical protein [Bdellovibrionales bacterium]
MNRYLHSLFVLVFALASTSCGSSGGSNLLLTNFSGVWQVTFNNILDDCGLLEEGTDTFEDQHTIMQTGSDVHLDADQLPGGTYDGGKDGENSFVVSSRLEGDLFGTGFNCVLTEDLRYTSSDTNIADLLYNIHVVCEDSSSCDSAIRGVGFLE